MITKKTQSMPINVIVISLLVVIVLVVLVSIFTYEMSSSQQSFEGFSNNCQIICEAAGLSYTPLLKNLCEGQIIQSTAGESCSCYDENKQQTNYEEVYICDEEGCTYICSNMLE